jgi:hypothetical protein
MPVITFFASAVFIIHVDCRTPQYLKDGARESIRPIPVAGRTDLLKSEPVKDAKVEHGED